MTAGNARSQLGVSLLEVLITLGLAAGVALVSLTTAIPWFDRERLRAAVHDVQSSLQLDRFEAIKRNRPCRVVVDVAAKAIEVWDGMGTTATGDDVLLHKTGIPSTVGFAHPQGASPVTLDPLGAERYQAIFHGDGTVGSGDGEIVLHGGGRYQRLTLYVAGAVRLSTWNGSSWQL